MVVDSTNCKSQHRFRTAFHFASVTKDVILMAIVDRSNAALQSPRPEHDRCGSSADDFSCPLLGPLSSKAVIAAPLNGAAISEILGVGRHRTPFASPLEKSVLAGGGWHHPMRVSSDADRRRRSHHLVPARRSLR